jgi:hypothetical protein
VCRCRSRSAGAIPRSALACARFELTVNKIACSQNGLFVPCAVPLLTRLGAPHQAPHPDTSLRNGSSWWSAFRKWDTMFAAKVATDGWRGFDGVDIDTEGSDDATSPENAFTPALIALIGTFAQARGTSHTFLGSPTSSTLNSPLVLGSKSRAGGGCHVRSDWQLKRTPLKFSVGVTYGKRQKLAMVLCSW